MCVQAISACFSRTAPRSRVVPTPEHLGGPQPCGGRFVQKCFAKEPYTPILPGKASGPCRPYPSRRRERGHLRHASLAERSVAAASDPSRARAAWPRARRWLSTARSRRPAAARRCARASYAARGWCSDCWTINRPRSWCSPPRRDTARPARFPSGPSATSARLHGPRSSRPTTILNVCSAHSRSQPRSCTRAIGVSRPALSLHLWGRSACPA